MNKILQERLHKARLEYEDSLALPEWDRKQIHGIDFEKGADFALNHQWINIDESLPPCHDNVISHVSIGVIVCTSKGVIRYAYYYYYLHQWFSAETSTRIDNVTKWMFVPGKGGEK